jgi:predicted amidohydrolase
MRISVSLGQINVRFGDPEANFQQARDDAREAKRRGSALLLFPELFLSGYDLSNRERYAAPSGEGAFAQLSVLAREHGIALGGTVLERRKDTYQNTFALFDAGGNYLALYRKTHLFSPMEERRFLTAGDAFTLAQTPWGATGLAICYDLRFPEMMRRYALLGAQLILLPAQWPRKRIDHWQTLLRSRAIENQVFVAGCNCAGESGRETFGGRSAIIDPWGRVVAEGGDTPELLTAEIDLDLVKTVRRDFPVLGDRREDLYQAGGESC